MNIFLYGPSGSGKSTTCKILAQNLGLDCFDLDQEIESSTSTTVDSLFAVRGEAGFREIESQVLQQFLSKEPHAVVALGGGALLNPRNRTAVEKSSRVICLSAEPDTLLARLQQDELHRPLLEGNPQQRLHDLLQRRQEHYASFGTPLDTTGLSPQEIAWEAQIRLGAFRISGMGKPYDARIRSGCLDSLGESLQERNLKGPLVLVSDENVGSLYAEQAMTSLKEAGFTVSEIRIPAGEQYKTIETVASLWEEFLHAGVERGSTIIALGGGVTGDLAGFAAATFLRGVAWVNVPTTLLAMVDSSIGGKTGADLPQGKNLIGAFHSPRLVLADPQLLHTLPNREIRSGLAEALKAGIIADPLLYRLCAAGWPEQMEDVDLLVSRALAVKARVIEEDPYEKNIRQSLNLGHTVGHGVELASGYRLSHGESVGIGMVVEARLAEHIGIAQSGLANEISATLTRLGLPTRTPLEISRKAVIVAILLDKKRRRGQIHFALPEKIGKVHVGVVVDQWENLIEL